MPTGTSPVWRTLSGQWQYTNRNKEMSKGYIILHERRAKGKHMAGVGSRSILMHFTAFSFGAEAGLGQHNTIYAFGSVAHGVVIESKETSFDTRDSICNWSVEVQISRAADTKSSAAERTRIWLSRPSKLQVEECEPDLDPHRAHRSNSTDLQIDAGPLTSPAN